MIERSPFFAWEKLSLPTVSGELSSFVHFLLKNEPHIREKNQNYPLKRSFTELVEESKKLSRVLGDSRWNDH